MVRKMTKKINWDEFIELKENKIEEKAKEILLIRR